MGNGAGVSRGTSRDGEGGAAERRLSEALRAQASLGARSARRPAPRTARRPQAHPPPQRAVQKPVGPQGRASPRGLEPRTDPAGTHVVTGARRGRSTVGGRAVGAARTRGPVGSVRSAANRRGRPARRRGAP